MGQAVSNGLEITIYTMKGAYRVSGCIWSICVNIEGVPIVKEGGWNMSNDDTFVSGGVSWKSRVAQPLLRALMIGPMIHGKDDNVCVWRSSHCLLSALGMMFTEANLV